MAIHPATRHLACAFGFSFNASGLGWRGYDKDHPRIELLRLKGCVAWQQCDNGAWLNTVEPKHRVVGFLDSAKPLVKWLDTNVGPSELEGRWG